LKTCAQPPDNLFIAQVAATRHPLFANFQTFFAGRRFAKMSPACYRTDFDERKILGFAGGVRNDSSRRIHRRWHLFASAFSLAAAPLTGFGSSAGKILEIIVAREDASGIFRAPFDRHNGDGTLAG
jgi:hypothetical protein